MSKEKKADKRTKIPLAAPIWRGIRKIGADQWEVTLGNSVHDYCLTVSAQTIKDGLAEAAPLFQPPGKIVPFRANH